jgi:predicted Zn-dependent protease
MRLHTNQCGKLPFVKASLVAILIGVLQAQDLSQQGAAAMRAGRYDEAEKIFQKLAQQQPNIAGWHGNLGLALYSQRKYAAAAAALEKSLKLQPVPGLFTVLGVSYLRMGDACKAIAPLEKGARTESLAEAYLGCRRYADAAKQFEKKGQRRDAAHAYWLARDYESARPHFAAVETAHRNDPAFAFEYGDTLLRAVGASEALPYLETARSLPAAQAALGKAYGELKRFGEAIPYLEGAVKLDPDLWLPLSRAYKETGRAADAERALTEYKNRSVQN